MLLFCTDILFGISTLALWQYMVFLVQVHIFKSWVVYNMMEIKYWRIYAVHKNPRRDIIHSVYWINRFLIMSRCGTQCLINVRWHSSPLHYIDQLINQPSDLFKMPLAFASMHFTLFENIRLRVQITLARVHKCHDYKKGLDFTYDISTM